MVRSFLISIGLISFIGLNAQTITILDEGVPYGGFMPHAISPSGKYVGGSSFAGMMFISNWADNKNLVIDESFGSQYENYGSEIRGISDTGIGVGFDDKGAVIVDLNNDSYKVLMGIDRPKEVYDVLASSITADGSLIVGSVLDSKFNPLQVYWENEELNYLPLPENGDFGFNPEGYGALQVTADGSIIMGYAVDNFSTKPLVLWFRQEDGSYLCDPVFQEYFDGSYGSKEFLRFSGLSINRSGTSIIMKVQYNTEDPEFLDLNLLALYSISDKKLEVIHVDGEHGIERNVDFDVWFNGISDNNTVVGWYIPSEGGRYPFIMYGDELQPTKLSLAFPNLEKLQAYDDSEEHALSGISADSRYICGMGVDYSDNLHTYIYEGYVIDTQNDDAGVSTVNFDCQGKIKYLGIDGQTRNGLTKGINIIRYPDGLVKKVLIK